MAVDAILFDIGGVIVDADLERYASVAARFFEATEDDLRLAVQDRVPRLETGQIDSETFWKEVGEWLWSKGKGKLAEPSICKGLWKKLLADKMKINMQMLNLCWSLARKGMVVGALSNTIVEHAEYLAALGAYQPFRPCILSFQVGMRKPNRDIYQLAAKKTGKAIKKILLIDDSLVNCEGARAVGMQAHHFTAIPLLVAELGKHKLL